VLSWNLLARPYTKYNQRQHCSGEELESEEQTRSRYTLAGREIVAQGCDVVLLQECDPDFFEERWNAAALDVNREYTLYPCFVNMVPGTAVLVRKDGKAHANAKAVCIGGTDSTGGWSKVATVLPVRSRAGLSDFVAVSAHMTWDGQKQKRQHHVDLVSEHLGKTHHGTPLIFGGDFNCQLGPSLDELESSTFLGGMRRAKLPEGTLTACGNAMVDGAAPETIDHIYLSQCLNAAAGGFVGAQPSVPWARTLQKDVGAAKVVAPSDHVHVRVEVQ